MLDEGTGDVRLQRLGPALELVIGELIPAGAAGDLRAVEVFGQGDRPYPNGGTLPGARLLGRWLDAGEVGQDVKVRGLGAGAAGDTDQRGTEGSECEQPRAVVHRSPP